MAAARAESVEFKSVGLNREAISCCDFLLQFLDFTVFELNDFPASRADEVVVMAFVGDVIVLGLRPEVSGLGDAGIAEEV